MTQFAAGKQDDFSAARDHSSTVAAAFLNSKRPVRGLRCLRRLTIVILFLGVGWVFREHILIGLAEILIAESGRPPANVVVVLDEGDRRFDVVAERHRHGANSVLLYRRQPNRLEQLEILPATDKVARRELLKRHLPSDALESLPEVPIGRSQFVMVLSQWLEKHPNQTVDLLSDRFSSRTWEMLVRRSTDAEVQRRIYIRSLRHRDYDETDWWKSKRGTQAFVNGYLTLGYHVLAAGKEPPTTDRISSDFQAAFAGGPSK